MSEGAGFGRYHSRLRYYVGKIIAKPHAADDVLRSEIMPVNERYPLAEVLAA